MIKLNFVSRMVGISLISLGMIKDGKTRATYSIIFGILCSGGFLGTVVGFVNTRGAGYKLESLASVLANFNSVVLFVAVNSSLNRITQLFVLLKGSKEDADEMIARTNKHIKKELIWYIVVLIAQGSIFTSITAVFSVLDEEIDNMFSVVVPFWFSCSNIGSDSRVFCIRWEKYSRMELLVANIIQVVFLTLQFVVYICCFALYGISIGELVMHLENIKSKVKRFNMQNREGLVFENRRPSNFNPRLIQREKRNMKDLLEIVNHQQYLHNCILQAVHAWKPYLTCIYTTSFVDITMVLFTIFMEQENSTIFLMKAASLVMFRFLMLFIISSYAQTLSTLNIQHHTDIQQSDNEDNQCCQLENFHNNARLKWKKIIREMFEETANLRWYEQSLKFRKHYTTVLILNQRGIQMLAGDIIRVNLNSFLQLMKTIYSILNILTLKYGR